MSFADIQSSAPTTAPPASGEDGEFSRLQNSLSLQVFKMNANVQRILKLVDQLGTTKDSAPLRKNLHDLTESTRAMAKRSSEDLKKLTALQHGEGRTKAVLAKTSHDLQLSLVAFQRAQQVSVERQRTVVEGVKLAVEEEQPDIEQAPAASPSQRQAQIMQSQLSPHELAYQESLIQERENDIREIETGIHELSELFRDLGTMVHEQGEQLVTIESHMNSVAADTQRGSEELTVAAEYQRKAGRRAACLMIVVVIVTAIVLLAVLN